MRQLWVFASIIACALTGCVSQNRDTTLYHPSGRTKPMIAVLPVINHAGDTPVPWDTSQEITQSIRNRFLNSSKLYLLKETGSKELALQLNVTNPSQIPQISPEAIGSAEFVVITELLDDSLNAFGLGAESEKPYLEEVGAKMCLSMRVRVLDIRNEKPRIILQEVINHEHLVGKGGLSCDYKKSHWGTNAYVNTPVGMAHTKIAREIVARVEGYVGANKG